ncbi:hypothetical protein CEXT_44051 [Caerostris extrusa]|uniref:Uncharacterized protein n=1 Tax=Caerostris extrusa TaxID=172846 RepID=A0AAV4NFQ8_CAEEX|nr:hypothetical protein CEXT_44051 [Caerostris extrusa]
MVILQGLRISPWQEMWPPMALAIGGQIRESHIGDSGERPGGFQQWAVYRRLSRLLQPPRPHVEALRNARPLGTLTSDSASDVLKITGSPADGYEEAEKPA